MKKIAMVVTNATGPLPSGPTGLFMPELAHPYFALVDRGYTPVLVSPRGGPAAHDTRHIDQFMDDPAVARFMNDAALMGRLQDTAAPEALEPEGFAGVVYVGGHGAPFDFRASDALRDFGEAVHRAGGVVAGICHGVAGLVDLRDAAGEPLVAGRRVTGFSNEEEGDLRDVMPFLLEDELLARGARYSRVRAWTSNVEVDGRLVTGQQHRSAEAFTEALVRVLGEDGPALVRRWFDELPGMSDAAFAGFLDPDFVNHPAPPHLRDGAANFVRVLRYVGAAAKDARYTVEHVVDGGPLVVARVRWAGHFDGEYLGVRGNGGAFDVPQYHCFRIEGGRLAEHWAVRDDLSVFRQAGVTPPA